MAGDDGGDADYLSRIGRELRMLVDSIFFFDTYDDDEETGMLIGELDR